MPAAAPNVSTLRACQSTLANSSRLSDVDGAESWPIAPSSWGDTSDDDGDDAGEDDAGDTTARDTSAGDAASPLSSVLALVALVLALGAVTRLRS